MAKAEMVEEQMNVPDGGIAELVMDDSTADAVYDEEDAAPEGGIAQFKTVAEQMAAMGREGDNMLAHLESGELVIPRKFLDENEQFRNYVYAFFDGQGVDPERYIAGNDANSINPDTGVAEFFLKKIFKGIKKAVKKVVSGVKKVVKKVVNVVKKVAPVVLPIIGSMIFGPVFGAAAGSGIATLINGGSVKDALKSALFAGAGGALGAGIGGMVSGVGFGAGVQAAINPANITQGFSAIGTAAKNMSFKGTGIGFSTMKYGMAGGQDIQAAQLANQLSQSDILKQGVPAAEGDISARLSTSNVDPSTLASNEVAAATTDQVGTQIAADKAATINIPQGTTGTFKENIIDAFTPGGKGFGQSLGDAFLPSGPSVTDVLKANPGMSLDVAKQLAADAAPSFLAKTLPLAGAATAGLAAVGGFKTPPQEDPNLVERTESGEVVTGETKIAETPGDYLIGELQPGMVLDPNTGQYVVNTAGTQSGAGDYEVKSIYDLNLPSRSTPSGPFARPQPYTPYPQMYAAEGGSVPDLANDPRLQKSRDFPRRNGGIMPNEGIPGQDSVRAMLMPGEFVMTTDAVRGLGGGNLNQGINNMYSVMRNLEARGRGVA